LAEVVAALTALTIWATSNVTALAAVLLSLALEEPLMVERVDSRIAVRIRFVRDMIVKERTDVGDRAGDGRVERVDDARGVCLALLHRDICLWSRSGCRNDAGEDARESEDESELHADGSFGRAFVP
jgi:hypothetical protein